MAPAEVQAGVSCLLADVSPALVQLRYHIAYRIQSGQVDSLAWHVPSGYVLDSIQAPQLAAIRSATPKRHSSGSQEGRNAGKKAEAETAAASSFFPGFLASWIPHPAFRQSAAAPPTTFRLAGQERVW